MRPVLPSRLPPILSSSFLKERGESGSRRGPLWRSISRCKRDIGASACSAHRDARESIPPLGRLSRFHCARNHRTEIARDVDRLGNSAAGRRKDVPLEENFSRACTAGADTDVPCLMTIGTRLLLICQKVNIVNLTKRTVFVRSSKSNLLTMLRALI